MNRRSLLLPLAALVLLPVFAAGNPSSSDRDFAAGLKAVQDAARESRIEALRQPQDRRPALHQAAEEIARRISPDPGDDLESLFHPDFLKTIPIERIKGVLRKRHSDYGAVKAVSLMEMEGGAAGWFSFDTGKGLWYRVRLAVQERGAPLVTGLLLKGAAGRHRSVEEAVAALKQLPGTVSFQISKLGEDARTLHALNPDLPLAIGSAFKLYLLAGVAEDGSWGKTAPLSDDYKRLSQDLQGLPSGTPVEVRRLAELMISVSDNGATDHLLDVLGRERVEDSLARLGNSVPSRSKPFLHTLEFIRLKCSPELLARYVAADAQGKRDLLAGPVLEVPWERLKPWMEPRAIDSVEWFASAADLARLMDHFRRTGDETALKILAINPGLDFPEEDYSYVGFKGGSEAGVLNLTWLVKDRKGDYYALSAGWNDPAAALDNERFTSILQSVIYLLPQGR